MQLAYGPDLLLPGVRVQPARRCRVVRLRPGNEYSADGVRVVLDPVIARYPDTVSVSISEGMRALGPIGRLQHELRR
jgi:hypothetical protein